MWDRPRLSRLPPAKELPPQIPVLQNAEKVPASFDPNKGTEVVEATGISTVKLSDIPELLAPTAAEVFPSLAAK